MARGDQKSRSSSSEPVADVYCGLLFVSFAALVACCVILFLQLKWHYGGF